MIITKNVNDIVLNNCMDVNISTSVLNPMELVHSLFNWLGGTFDSLHPISNLSVMLGRVVLG